MATFDLKSRWDAEEQTSDSATRICRAIKAYAHDHELPSNWKKSKNPTKINFVFEISTALPDLLRPLDIESIISIF